MSEYERVEELRRNWAPQDKREVEVEEPGTLPLRQYNMAPPTEADQPLYQRCGGGYRVIRKRIGG